MKFYDNSSDNEPFRSKQNSQVIFIDFLSATFDRRRTEDFESCLKFARGKYGKRKNPIVGDET
jgi:hypothetical protein